MGDAQGNISPIQGAPDPIDPRVRIGHAHLRTTTGDILFVSAGGYHRPACTTSRSRIRAAARWSTRTTG